MTNTNINGVLLMNKPQGFTSFDVIAKLRGILKIKRLGHSGTLDPMATGVLPIFVGKATKACDILPNNEKSYTADFALGFETDTQDISGKETARFSAKASRSEVEAVLKSFVGETDQLPPMFSAVQVDGQRLYDLARQGIEVERKARKIRVFEISLLDFDEQSQSGRVFISCGKGTYIRTIIHDMGRSLGTGGVMTSLVRNSSSGYKLCDCMGFDEISQMVAEGRLSDVLLPIDTCFEVYPKAVLGEWETKLYKNGVVLRADQVRLDTASELYRVYGFDGEFLGIGRVDFEAKTFHCEKNFYG